MVHNLKYYFELKNHTMSSSKVMHTMYNADLSHTLYTAYTIPVK